MSDAEITRHEAGDAQAEVGARLRGRLDDLAVLVPVAEGDWSELEPGLAESVDLDPDGDMQDQAQTRLYEYPLCVEATTTFEIVLGTGGPDDRLLIECDTSDRISGTFPHEVIGTDYEIRRVLYRYSWSGSAEVELVGEDKEVAEVFARRVVPELAE